MRADLTLLWLHVAANVLWIGSIAAVALVMLADKPDAKTRGELALRIYLRLSAPAFVASFVGGLVRFLMDVGHYGKTPWMHIKLTFAVAVIALHHVIGGRAKKMARGDVSDAGPTRGLLAALIACAILAVFFAIQRIPAGGP